MQDPLEALKESLKDTLARFPEIRDTRRTIRKTFYVTPEENQQIDQLRQGINQSRFFRSRVLGKNIPRPKPVTPYISRESHKQLKLIGRDINRIANALSTTNNQQRTEITKMDRELLHQLKVLLGDVQKEIISHVATQTSGTHD